MLIACWSVKGGAGTTVVSAALAALSARSRPGGALLVDLAGDLPVVLGLDHASAGPGLAAWLGAGDDATAGALAALEVPVRSGIGLLPRGEHRFDAPGPAGDLLVGLLAADPRPVIVDCGVIAGPSHPSPSGDLGSAVATSATVSLLVLRPCFLALRKAVQAQLRPSGVVFVDEPGRSIGVHDVEEVLGVPVRAYTMFDPDVARAVDAGTLLEHIPRTLRRGLRAAA